MAALRLLHRLETARRPLDELLPALDREALAPRDLRLARQLVLGVLRWQKRLDWMLDQCSHRPVARLSPWARLALRLGAYQLFWLDRVPPHAAISTAVSLARRCSHEGIAGLVNAVLRRLAAQPGQLHYPDPAVDPLAYLAVYHSHPTWLVERWVSRWGLSTAQALLAANNEKADLCIHLNPLRATQEALRAELELEPVGALPGYFRVSSGARLFASRAYAQGLFHVQDPNAGLAVALLAPRPGERVLDLCSAPGGKAVHQALAMEDTGLIVAVDLSLLRLRRVRDTARRLGLRAIRPLVQDGCGPLPGGFDRVLADVPCSATGVLGRHPDIRWRRQPDQLPGLVARQQAILGQAFACLRPGGVLVYSTCSLEEEENERVVEGFLQQHPAARLEPASSFFPGRPWAGRYVQTLPGRDQGDGSFAARLRKEGP
jgi:16S rRNA (cytosine967-C5)-methyltransferase